MLSHAVPVILSLMSLGAILFFGGFFIYLMTLSVSQNSYNLVLLMLIPVVYYTFVFLMSLLSHKETKEKKMRKCGYIFLVSCLLLLFPFYIILVILVSVNYNCLIIDLIEFSLFSCDIVIVILSILSIYHVVMLILASYGLVTTRKERSQYISLADHNNI